MENELRQIYAQTVQPKEVLIFIPEGYKRPEFQIADEQYIQVKKGMASQRLRSYDDVKTDYILMLDDDVSLQPESVEKLLEEAKKNKTDIIGADTFCNYKLPFSKKLYAAITNLVLPHFSQKWAFKILPNASFSYLNNPRKNYYPSQSCAGNVMLWKTESYNSLKMEDELWIDNLPFAYGDDMLESYKVYKNGRKLGVVFNSGIKHLDYRSASDSFRKSPDFIKKRTLAQIAVWCRTCYQPEKSNFKKKSLAQFCFILKKLWQFKLFLLLSLIKFNFSYIGNYIKGLKEGWKFVHSEMFKNLPPYVIR
ncbi:MAG: glycosyltransferase [Erysipelotrichales bacterium]|nr:glycosyltransferase [Erysipelotrichales bacterium]